jgi:hypothetical protein
MSGNPRQCRVYAERCLKLAELAGTPEARKRFTELASIWTSLAARQECDQALLQTISELEFGKPYEALPLALNIRSEAA